MGMALNLHIALGTMATLTTFNYVLWEKTCVNLKLNAPVSPFPGIVAQHWGAIQCFLILFYIFCPGFVVIYSGRVYLIPVTLITARDRNPTNIFNEWIIKSCDSISVIVLESIFSFPLLPLFYCRPPSPPVYLIGTGLSDCLQTPATLKWVFVCF